ncbi:MAG: DUF364 domain-containing protein [Deltaproteobacteria bacterium]|jgi:uncharacterized protein (DUF4213/DUF364 family)|nr:DUF364 domain-containing protein [Deltaproteobacteria bacterium]
MGFDQSPRWELYDHLLASVPEDAVAAEAAFAPYWAAILSSRGGTGLAHILPHPQNDTPAPEPGSIIGRPLRELARGLKSWDETETAIGLAAVTASANSALLAAGLSPASPESGEAAFEYYLELARGRKVAVIGHFPGLDGLRKAASEFYILERQPEKGDLPDTAAEYLLPDMDLVFITGSSLVNKSLPRLLELAREAHTGLVGPSVPLLPSLFKFSLSSLSGTVFHDFKTIAKAIADGKTASLFKYGGFRVNLGSDFQLPSVNLS